MRNILPFIPFQDRSPVHGARGQDCGASPFVRLPSRMCCLVGPRATDECKSMFVRTAWHVGSCAAPLCAVPRQIRFAICSKHEGRKISVHGLLEILDERCSPSSRCAVTHAPFSQNLTETPRHSQSLSTIKRSRGTDISRTGARPPRSRFLRPL